MDTQLQKADSTSMFSVHMIYVCPFIFTIMEYDSPPSYSNYGMISFLAYKIFKSQYLFYT